MLRTTLKLIIRGTLNNISYSLTTMGGLIAGLTSAILIFLWISFELGYDHYHVDNDRVYAVMVNEKIDGSIETYEDFPIDIKDFLKDEVTDIEAVTRFDNHRALFSTGTTSLQRNGAYADAGYFQVFSPTIVEGDPHAPIPDNRSIAISTELAQDLFPNEHAIGKVVQVDLKNEFKITAIFDLFPVNSSLRNYHFILPIDTKATSDEWLNYEVKLRAGADKARAESLIDKKLKEHFGNTNFTSLLFPLTDWRLHWNFENGKVSGGRIIYVVTFGIAGLFILIMGCINHINITTARAMRRAREIGVKKVAGATRAILIRQFMMETMAIVTIAACVSLFLAWVLLPFFNTLTNTRLSLDLFDPTLIVALLTIVLMTGVLAGSYPAFLLSSLKPARVLKGDTKDSLRGGGVRKILVTLQLSLSIILIFASLVLKQQTDFLLQMNLGFDKKNVIDIWLDDSQSFPLDQIRSEIANHTSIISAGLAGANPMEVNGSAEVTWPGRSNNSPLMINGASAHYEMLPTLNIKLLQGRNFSREMNDKNNFIVTQQGAKLLGFDNPVGQTIEYKMFGNQVGTIIGVIEDFQNEDIHLPADPVILTLGPDQYLFNMFVRYREGQANEAIAHIKSVFQKYQPGIPVNYNFLDNEFEAQFYQERLLNNLSTWATGVAIIISCLGLFGLTMFNTERKTKEIGIRKILGASVKQIVTLVLRDLFKPVIFALLVAFPFGYFLMESFLHRYVYRIGIGVDSYLAVSGCLIGLVVVTTLRLSIKAAGRNPVDTIKTE